MKIIDSHAHICEYFNGLGAEGELRALGNGMVEYATGRTFRIIPEGMGDKGVAPETLLSIMDKYNVESAMLLQGHWLGLQNIYSYEAKMKYPTRFNAACMYDPFDSKADLIIKHFFEDLGFKYLKLECSNGSGLMANHHPFNLNDPIMEETLNTCEKYGVTFIIDIGRPGNCCHQVDNLAKLIANHPSVTFVICHLLAYPNNMQEEFKKDILKLKYPNVYFDTASIMNNTKEEYPFPIAQSYIRYTMDNFGSDKVMFGSDMPSALKNHSYEENIKYILESNLFTKEEKENFYYNNAKKIYFNK